MFTKIITAVFRDLLRRDVMVVYMDIIILSKDMVEFLQRFVKVLEIVASNGLLIKWETCQILHRTVNFLGYIIQNISIRPAEENLKAVENFLISTDRKLLQRFLGLTSYFRKFIGNYAIVAKPLTDMLRKKNVQEALVVLQFRNCMTPTQLRWCIPMPACTVTEQCSYRKVWTNRICVQCSA